MSFKRKETVYSCNDISLKGYLAWDDDHGDNLPAVMVIHEWWGVTETVKARADKLAESGYCAFAIDMYGDGIQAESPDQAAELMNAVLDDMETGTERLQAAFETLLNQTQVDKGKIAAIGYCFGGGMALHMARIGMPLKAVTSFHGALGSFHTPGESEVKAKILVCHGADDAMVSMDDVAAFELEMDNADADYEVIVYRGAQHGFTSKQADVNHEKYGIPLGYDAAADAESWSAMIRLFGETLR